MSRKHYWWVGGIAIVVAALVVSLIAAATLDLNWARDRISAAVKERTGRALTIEGDLSLKLLSLRPRIRAEHVTLENAEWGEDAPMFASDWVEVSLSAVNLLRGRLVIQEAAVGEAQLLLERDSEGRNNWTFDSKQEKEQQEKEGEPLIVREFSADGLAVTVRDAPTETELQVDARTQEDGDVEFEIRASCAATRWRSKAPVAPPTPCSIGRHRTPSSSKALSGTARRPSTAR